MKKITLILFFALILTGCLKIASKEVIDKTSDIEPVAYLVSDPGYEYGFSCFGTGKKSCGYKYHYNVHRKKTIYKDEIVYRVVYLVRYENGKTKEVNETVSKDVYEQVEIGQVD